MNTYNVEFTEQQVKVLVDLLNIAVKAVGLEGARPALNIMDTLQQAVSASPQPAPEATTDL